MAKVNGELIGNLQDSHIVERSDPLFSMRDIPFSFPELKLIDIYISRIDISDPETRSVVFTKDQYDELLGLKRSSSAALDKATDSLLDKRVCVRVGEFWDKYSLFERAKYFSNEYGQKCVLLRCTESALDLFFCLKKYHFVGYELKNVLSLTSRHSYLLYLYIRKNRFRGTWTISVADLRDQILDLSCVSTYQDFRYLRSKVLNPAIVELCEKTDCHVSCSYIKTGRTVTEVCFTIASTREVPVVQQLTLDEGSGAVPAFCDGIFSAAETDELRSLLSALPEEERDRRIEQKYQLMKVYNEKKPVKNKFLYVKKALEKDCKKSAAPDQPVAEQEHSFDTQEFLDLAMKRSFKNETDGGKKE